ncbi:MAG: iron export ABC transporter permease subunit FetB [Desulfobacterales bacterium]|jgi:putative ABC transport system permease protein
MEAADISVMRLAVLYGMLLVPVWALWRLKIGLTRDILVSTIRMTVQLVFVGLYLKLIFQWNNIWVNGLWILIMTVVANLSALDKAGLVLRRFFWPTVAGLAAGSFSVVAVFILVLIQPKPWYDARYLIPLTGMILGNCLSGNVIVMERFYSGIRRQETAFLTYLLLGANLREAIQPFLREAIRSALAPTLATMMTIGIVSLPGMMTGQILGGSFPVVAIKYQIVIMVGIFISLTLSGLLNIFLSLPSAFDAYGMLNADLFNAEG